MDHRVVRYRRVIDDTAFLHGQVVSQIVSPSKGRG